MSGNLLNAIFIKVDMFLRTALFKGKCRRCLESGHMARDCKNPPKSWSAGVSSGGIAVEASARLGALLLVFWILPLLRLRVEVLFLSYTLRVPMPLVLGVLL